MARDSDGVRGVSGYVPKSLKGQAAIDYYEKQVKELRFKLETAERLLAAAKRNVDKATEAN